MKLLNQIGATLAVVVPVGGVVYLYADAEDRLEDAEVSVDTLKKGQATLQALHEEELREKLEVRARRRALCEVGEEDVARCNRWGYPHPEAYDGSSIRE